MCDVVCLCFFVSPVNIKSTTTNTTKKEVYIETGKRETNKLYV